MKILVACSWLSRDSARARKFGLGRPKQLPTLPPTVVLLATETETDPRLKPVWPTGPIGPFMGLISKHSGRRVLRVE